MLISRKGPRRNRPTGVLLREKVGGIILSLNGQIEY